MLGLLSAALSFVAIVQSAPVKLRARDQLALRGGEREDPNWRRDASSITPSAIAATSWTQSGGPLFPDGGIVVYAPVDNHLAEYRFLIGDNVDPQTTNMTKLPTNAGTGTTPITIPNEAPISASNSFDFNGTSICVFVGLDRESGNSAPGLYLYETIATAVDSGDDTGVPAFGVPDDSSQQNQNGMFPTMQKAGLNLTNILPLQQGLHSVASTAWSNQGTVTFSVVFQTSDNKIHLMERAGEVGNAWTAPIEIAAPNAAHQMSLIITSDTDRYLWLDSGDRYNWTQSTPWTQFTHNPAATNSSAPSATNMECNGFWCKIGQQFKQGWKNIENATSNLRYTVSHLQEHWHLSPGMAAGLRAGGNRVTPGHNGMAFSAVNVPGGAGLRLYATDNQGALLEGGVANNNFGMGAKSPDHIVAAENAVLAATAQQLSTGTYIYVFHQRFETRKLVFSSWSSNQGDGGWKYHQRFLPSRGGAAASSTDRMSSFSGHTNYSPASWSSSTRGVIDDREREHYYV
ncbi:hypothetical protein FRB96_000956 [Tulasnella sp. 330]|nr:hypothetical protein FRB96_000956 [Tulasnella sp. 330]